QKLEEQLRRFPNGLMGIIAVGPDYLKTKKLLEEHYPGRTWLGTGRRGNRNLALVTAKQAKGLEYDSVIIIEPQHLVEAANGAVGDLYVAMTRATQTLTMISTGSEKQLPPGLLDI